VNTQAPRESDGGFVGEQFDATALPTYNRIGFGTKAPEIQEG